MAIIIEYSPSKFVGKIELITDMGFPGNSSGKQSTCQCRRYSRSVGGFDLWLGKIP